MYKRIKLFSAGMLLALSANTLLYAQDTNSNGNTLGLENDFPVNMKIRQKNGPREKWPCLSYKKSCGKISTKKPEINKLTGKLNGNPKRGKMVALKKGKNKGNCIACHKLKDGVQYGTVGPDLSKYGTWGRSDAQTYTIVSDMRVRNPDTVMPPFGTNRILNDEAIRDVTAYLQSSK